MTNQNHPFHLVSPSPWPIIISFSIFNNLIFIVSWFHNMSGQIPKWYYLYSQCNFLYLSIPSTLICMYMWWRDVSREATFQGCHSKPVFQGLKMGMILFIISEFFFLFLFFEHTFTHLYPHLLKLVNYDHPKELSHLTPLMFHY